MARFEADRFRWQKDSRTLVAEASELGTRVPFHRLGNNDGARLAGKDALQVKGRTGKYVEYYLTSIDRTGDGDIGGWNFHPTPRSLEQVPAAQGTSVLVIND